MLIKAARTLQKLSPVIFQSMASMSSIRSFSEPSPLNIQKELLFPFKENQTLEALNQVHEYFSSNNRFEPQNLILLDQISETPDSMTHRVLDRYHNKLFSLKSLNLDSTASWKQLNLTLRQYQMQNSSLAKIHSIRYGERGSRVNIITELQNQMVGDYIFFREKNQISWTKEEMKILLLQILHQMNNLRSLGAACETITPQTMFIDKNTSLLKLYDFSSFTISAGDTWSLFSNCGSSLNIDAAIHSLVQIIAPYAPVHNVEEARAFIRNNHPEFVPELEEIESIIKKIESRSVANADTKIGEELQQHMLSKRIFEEKGYENFLMERLKEACESRNVENFSEKWALINYNFGKYQESIKILQEQLQKNQEESNESALNTGSLYFDIAENYEAGSYFGKAKEYLDKALAFEKGQPTMNKLLVAKIHNKFGSICLKQNNYQKALEAFDAAERTLREISKESPLLVEEVNNNVRLTQKVVGSTKAFSENPVQAPISHEFEDSNSEKESDQDTGNKPNYMRMVFRAIYYLILLKIGIWALKIIVNKTKKELDLAYPDPNLRSPDNKLENENDKLQCEIKNLKSENPKKVEINGVQKSVPQKAAKTNVPLTNVENLKGTLTDKNKGTAIVFGLWMLIPTLGLVL